MKERKKVFFLVLEGGAGDLYLYAVDCFTGEYFFHSGYAYYQPGYLISDVSLILSNCCLSYLVSNEFYEYDLTDIFDIISKPGITIIANNECINVASMGVSAMREFGIGDKREYMDTVTWEEYFR